MNPTYSREHLLQQMATADVYDVIVIGGGATGLGTALEAVTRGYKTLLIEQADFAKGTSSKSTKLVHGGVRYLAQGDVKLVREASIERGLLVKNAPHLVRNQTFIIPIYTFFDRIKYTIGLKMYDWIAGRLSLGSSNFIPFNKVAHRISTVKDKGLIGGIKYHDGQFDDARLAINLMQTIIDKGGVAINYMRVVDLHKDENGKLNGAKIQDQETQQVYSVKGKAIVNATGVFVDDILKMEKPGADDTITVSQGVHLVLEKKFWPSQDALMIPKTSDGRVLFAVPWHDKVVLGTTDTPVGKASLDPVALNKEIEFILNTAKDYLKVAPTRSDVLSVFAGLRPLAAPKKDTQKTKEISRSHKIAITPGHLFTMLGGKWTTFRKMAEDMVDAIEKTKSWPVTTTQTKELPIHGASSQYDWNHPFFYYGSDAAMIEQMIKESNEEWLNKELNLHPAQIRWAIQNEQARTIDDFISRRTRVLLLDAAVAQNLANKVAQIMAKELNKGEEWIQDQLKKFNELSNTYRIESFN